MILFNELAEVAARSFHPHAGTLSLKLASPSQHSTNMSHLAHCNLSGLALFKSGDRAEEEDLLNNLTETFLCFRHVSRVDQTVEVVCSHSHTTISQTKKKGLKGVKIMHYCEYLFTALPLGDA